MTFTHHLQIISSNFTQVDRFFSFGDLGIQTECVANALSQCGMQISPQQVVVCAVGKSARVGQLLVDLCISVNIKARFLHPTEGLHGDLGMVQKDDLILLLSQNGGSQELVKILPFLQKRTVQIFLMTTNIHSPLLKMGCLPWILPTPQEMCPLGQAPFSGSLTFLAVGHLAIARAMELLKSSKEHYAQNHPGGRIGARISLRVQDILAEQKTLPAVESSDSFINTVSAMTRFAKGAVLVINKSGVFQGLITEKDLRVAMEKGGEVFQLTAKNFMNPTPMVLPHGLFAFEAAKRMTSKKPAWNVMPVVDSISHQALGLVQLLDFIRFGVLDIHESD